MRSIICASRFLIVLTTLALVLIAHGEASAQSNLDQQLRSAITKVRQAKTGPRRYTAAEHLLAITYNCDCKEVTDETIHSLVSLLDIDDDAVQMWVAATLGIFGTRAKEAVPKLQSIYSVSACKIQDRGSDATIPIALRSMGVTVTHPKCAWMK